MESYRDGGKWSGIGPENCSNPKLLHETIVPKISDFIDSIIYGRFGVEKMKILRPHYHAGKRLWKSADQKRRGRCFTINHKESYLEEGIAFIKIITYQNAEGLVHYIISIEILRIFENFLNLRAGVTELKS